MHSAERCLKHAYTGPWLQWPSLFKVFQALSSCTKPDWTTHIHDLHSAVTSVILSFLSVSQGHHRLGLCWISSRELRKLDVFSADIHLYSFCLSNEEKTLILLFAADKTQWLKAKQHNGKVLAWDESCHTLLDYNLSLFLFLSIFF